MQQVCLFLLLNQFISLSDDYRVTDGNGFLILNRYKVLFDEKSKPFVPL